MRRLTDRATAALASLLLRVFFREIEVEGELRRSPGTPLLLVANHVNSVVDPLLLMACVETHVRMLAKSTLFRHPVMAPLLWLAAALPVYRRQDDGENPADNLRTFRRCHEALARGGAIALFPEGRSHNQPHALPLKTGAARIALEAEQRHGPLQLRVVPVGLTYEHKSRFRSRVLVRIGVPIESEPELSRYRDGARRQAVRAFTARIAAGLDAVTVSYASWEEARLVNRVAALVGGDQPLSHRSELWLHVLESYRALERTQPRRVAPVLERLAHYEHALAGLRLDDEDVAGTTRLARLRRRTDVVLGPLGRLLNGLPFQVTAALTRRLTRTEDESATYALLGGLVFFPLVWLLQAAAVGVALGPVAAVALAALAPLTGPAALRDHEARGLRQRVSLWPSAARLAELRAERAQLAGNLRALAATLSSAPSPR